MNHLDDARHEGFINARFLAQTVTGVQRYALELTEALDSLIDRGLIDLRTLALRLVVPRRTRPRELGLKHIPVIPVGRLRGELWTQLELPYRTKGRLLWSPGNTGPIYHDKHVVTIHDASVLDHPEWFSLKFSSWYRFLLPRLARRAARVLTVSAFSRRRLSETLAVDPERIFVVPNGVNPALGPMGPAAVEQMLEDLGLPRNYVLSLGTLEPRKNIARLLEAWSLLLEQNEVDEDVHLVLVGGNSSLFRNTGSLSLPDRVVRTGYVSDMHLAALYSGALVFVYPSLYEGFGLPPLEAMACGTPVIASNSTSIPEVVGDAALLVNPSSAESLADGLLSVLNNAAFQTHLRVKGLKRAEQFSWDYAARSVWQHLTDVAADS